MKTISRNQCLITGSYNLEELYTFPDFSVHQNTTDDSVDTDLKLDLIFDICRDSGMIQVRNVVPEEVLYNAEHSRSIGATWQKHHREFAAFLSAFKPENVFEIGGGGGVS